MNSSNKNKKEAMKKIDKLDYDYKKQKQELDKKEQELDEKKNKN